MVWCEVILASAVAFSTMPLVVNGFIQEQDLSNTDLVQEQDELDTELLQEQSYFGMDSLRYGIDAAGNIVNYTGNQRGYKMENISDQVKTMTERGKKCKPTLSCDHAGGFCVKRKSDCKGTIDPFGCRGSKKCKCCLPEPINWLKAGADRFFRLDQKMNFTDARKFCKRFGNHIDLYQPRNSTLVSKILQENFPETYQYSWLGARGNGSNVVWIPSGDVMTEDDPWSNPAYGWNQTDTDACVWLVSNEGRERGVLANQNGGCSRATTKGALCG